MMLPCVHRISLPAACILLTGCVPALFGGDRPRLITDQTAYDATVTGRVYQSNIYGFRVIARFENRSGRAVYLERCGPRAPAPMYTVAFANGSGAASSSPAYDQAWACVGHQNHIEVAANGVRIDTLMLRGPNAFNGVTHEPSGVAQGRFRLEYSWRQCQDDSCDRGRVVSNAFIVRVD